MKCCVVREKNNQSLHWHEIVSKVIVKVIAYSPYDILNTPKATPRFNQVNQEGQILKDKSQIHNKLYACINNSIQVQATVATEKNVPAYKTKCKTVHQQSKN